VIREHVGGLERSRRRARISSPSSGWVLGVPFLTRRTCRTATLNSTWSQRRSHKPKKYRSEKRSLLEVPPGFWGTLGVQNSPPRIHIISN
jgi:hypothetical protein